MAALTYPFAITRGTNLTLYLVVLTKEKALADLSQATLTVTCSNAAGTVLWTKTTADPTQIAVTGLGKAEVYLLPADTLTAPTTMAYKLDILDSLQRLYRLINPSSITVTP